MRRLRGLLLREDGIALVMVIGVLAVLTVSGGMVAYYSSTNARGSAMSKSQALAYSLAEAGIADALSRLSNDPANVFLFPSPTTQQLEGGSYTYTASHSEAVWTITSTGKIANPTGNPTADLSRVLTRKVDILGPTESGSLSAEWNRILHDSSSSCFNVPINLPVNVAARGDLCLSGTGSVTGSSSRVSVGDDIQLQATAYDSTRAAGAGAGWTNSSRIVSSNDSWATNSVTGGQDGANLDATSFGFSIPSDARILGITARVERASPGGSGVLRDDLVQLLKSGSPVGSDKAVTGSTWGTVDFTRTYGSSSDLWGTTWTPAEINAMGLRFRAHSNSSTLTANVDYIEIEVDYERVLTAVGSSGTPVQQVDVGDWCQAGWGPQSTPCSSADRVWGGTITTSNTVGNKPTANFPYWWWFAKLGPKHPCTEVVGIPPTFDSNAASTWWPDGSNSGQELTPNDRDYQCRSRDAQGNVVAELSWNRTTRAFTVKGTIYFDGPAHFHDENTSPIHYQGRASIWISEEWHNDEPICAGGSGATNCRTNMSSWDPSQNLLMILAGGTRGSGNDDWEFHYDDSAFQGVLYAENDCLFYDQAFVSGPVICDRVIFSDSTPQFFAWPALPGSTTGQLHPAGTTRDMQPVVGSQSG